MDRLPGFGPGNRGSSPRRPIKNKNKIIKKRKMRKDKFLPAIAVLVGTVVGAGFLGIPYVVSKTGFLIGIISIIFIGIFMMIINLYLGEITLRTKENSQLPGYAKKYIGQKGKILTFFAMIFGIFSALLAYILGVGRSLSYIFLGNFQYGFIFSLLFWALISCLTFIGLRALKKYEKISFFTVISLFIIILFYYSNKIQADNLLYTNLQNMFLPFGVIVFSFLGFAAIPEVKRILRTQEKKMKLAIKIGCSIPIILYSLFTFVVLGYVGINVNEIATLSLGRFFSVLGILTMIAAYFVLSLAVRDTFRFDFKLSRKKSWMLSSFIPLFLFIIFFSLNLDSFTQILEIGGIVSGGITGILILFMNYKSKKTGKRTPEYQLKINKTIIFIMSLIFIIAVFFRLRTLFLF
jgi:tyrosine-specific transport protein